jgi:hypothetical protein
VSKLFSLETELESQGPKGDKDVNKIRAETMRRVHFILARRRKWHLNCILKG